MRASLRMRTYCASVPPEAVVPVLTGWGGGDSDEYCPHCDNHFVLDAKTPKASLQVEGEDARIDSRYQTQLGPYRVKLMRCRMIKDERVQQEGLRTIFDVKEAPNKLG